MPNILIGAPLQANGPFPITITATFSNATRPAAATWSDGFIWNTDALEVQFSDGTNWYPASTGGFITWTQSTPWATIAAQIQPNTGTFIMLVDDGTANQFSLNAPCGDLSAVTFYGSETFIDQPSIFVDAGWSTTSSYLSFYNCEVVGRSAALVPSGSSVVSIQGVITSFSLDGAATGPMVVIDPGNEFFFYLINLSQVQSVPLTGPVVTLGQGSTVGINLVINGSLGSSISDPIFALAGGATAATASVGADNSSTINAYTFGAGITATGFHTEQGSAAFATGGTGAGYDFVDVTFAIPYTADIDWTLSTLIPLLTTDGDPAPVIYYSLPSGPSTTGFRIRTNAPFNGSVTWRVNNTLR